MKRVGTYHDSDLNDGSMFISNPIRKTNKRSQNGRVQAVQVVEPESESREIRSTRTLAHTVLNQGGTGLIRTLSCHNLANFADENGRTPLIYAILSGEIDRVDEWLARRADVNQCDTHGLTPLMAAAQCGNAHALARLLDRHADVHAVDGQGCTAMIYLESLRTFPELGLANDDSLHGYLKQAFIDKLKQDASRSCGIDVETYDIDCTVVRKWAQAHPPKHLSEMNQGDILPYHVYQWMYNFYVRIRDPHETLWDMTFENVLRSLQLCVQMHGKDHVFQSLKDGKAITIHQGRK